MRRAVTVAGFVVAASAATVLGATTQPAEIIAVASDSGIIAILDKADASQTYTMLRPFRTAAPVPLAVGDFNGDGRDDVACFGDGSVRFIDTLGVVHRSFVAYPGFTGGVRVAVGDVDGDGRDDVITGAGPGAPGGHVKVFSGATGAEIRSFLAFPGFNGGVFVAGGDINGDGHADIVVGEDVGLVPAVKVFNGLTLELHGSFLAYGPTFGGGVRVGAADINGDGFADVITGAGPGGVGGHVKVFDGTRGYTEMASFFSFDPSFSGGVFVAGGQGEVMITAGTATGAISAVRIFRSGGQTQWLQPFPSYKGGLTIGTSPSALGKAPTRAQIPGGYKVDTTW